MLLTCDRAKRLQPKGELGEGACYNSSQEKVAPDKESTNVGGLM